MILHRTNRWGFRLPRKIVVIIMFCFCLLPPALNGHEVSKFDEWGDLPFSDEKARLDNIAIQWQ